LKKDRRTLLLLLLILALALGLGYYALAPALAAGASAGGSSSAEASTPYGESLSIKLGGGSSTSKASILIPASWLASYQDDDSQNVYQVNTTYKEQELVTLEYDLSVTYANVASITATVKIKAIDNADASYYEYTLANVKSISGASPISDDGSTQKSISAHLTDITASVTSATVKYQIYCTVSATGTVSGDTLTATIPYTQFGKLVYLRSSESSAAEVTPTVSVASYFDEYLGLPGEALMTILAATAVLSSVIILRRTWK